ncbi:pesticin C-terminus-like muramidase [Erwinia sp. 198]|uniref:pesticin C-terminus-like muramidase n=1 Tax=Erwinia sp. 198 TaxID=2022746 RepID=UPI000F65DF26|nr:pesticin C-terminus-like muramidase [Erwinia sp. 198]RRZ92939.1 hypothetical protein EGK14_09460 [Erwinia sp. 198]
MLEPEKGLLTFRAEGSNSKSSLYFSRKIHFPQDAERCDGVLSGVTLGRGYDLGHRSRSEIISDLTYAGLPVSKAKKLAEASRLTGCEARNFVKKHHHEIGIITEIQQVKLFEKIYPDYEVRAKNNYNSWLKNRSDIVPWGSLSLAIKNVLIDFVYQGYTKSARPMLAGAHNNPQELINYIRNTPTLRDDEPDRQRVNYLLESR